MKLRFKKLRPWERKSQKKKFNEKYAKQLRKFCHKRKQHVYSIHLDGETR